MYARDIEDQQLTFGVSGKLIMNALVMFDRETETLWSQFLGRAVKGPLADTELEVIPAVLTRWESWRALHPDTTVLDQGGQVIDAYTGYYFSPSAGVIGERNPDDRLVGKELVLGVVLPQGRKAYAHRFLAKNPVVNDSIGNQPVLVAWDGDGATAIAYDPHGRWPHAQLRGAGARCERRGGARHRDRLRLVRAHGRGALGRAGGQPP